MNYSKKNQIQPIYKNGRYYNFDNQEPESFLFQTIPSFLSSLRGRKKRLPENRDSWFVQEEVLSCALDPHITWIGHASFLIQIGGINILTDPLFGNASRFFPRIMPVGVALDSIPCIDIVLLSHNHPDHCDIKSLKNLQKQCPQVTFLVPKGDKKTLERSGLANVNEYLWWDSHTVTTNDSITFTFLPAYHWSGAGIFDRNRSLWGSWMISYKDTHIYFAGDTAYAPHFTNIASHFPVIHTALMPIGPIKPHPWMRKSHVDAYEAVQAFLDLKAQHFIPMHWGTFQFGHDTFGAPLERLDSAWKQFLLHQRQDKKLSVLKIGQRIPI